MHPLLLVTQRNDTAVRRVSVRLPVERVRDGINLHDGRVSLHLEREREGDGRLARPPHGWHHPQRVQRVPRLATPSAVLVRVHERRPHLTNTVSEGGGTRQV